MPPINAVPNKPTDFKPIITAKATRNGNDNDNAMVIVIVTVTVINYLQ